MTALSARTKARRNAMRLCAILLFAITARAEAQDPARRITLGDAARLSAERGNTAVAARERASQSGAKARQMRADLLPSFSTDALIDGGSDGAAGISAIPVFPQSERTVDVRFKVTQRLFDLSAVRRWQASNAEADAAEAQAYAAGEDAAEKGALAYVKVMRAEARLAARIADSILAVELLDIARQQLAAGTAIALDVTRGESQLAASVSQLIAIRSERAQAQLELLKELALPVNSEIDLADSLRHPSPEDIEIAETDAVRNAFARRGDVLAAEASAVAARRQISAAKAERLPSISLFGSAGSDKDGMLDTKSYGVQLSLPLFDGLRREARIEEGRAREREAEAQYEDARLRTEVEVRSALLELSSARERVTAAGVQLRLAEQEVAQARERFRAGVAGNADVISASLTLNTARDQVVDALAAYHGARVSLASAQGSTTTLR